MILFSVLSVLLVASALFTVTARRPVHSVLGLLANFAALAVLYLSLSAEFLAVIQIVVYSGAILILFVFVIALLSSGVAPFEVGPNRMPRIALPAVVLAVTGAWAVWWGTTQAHLVPATVPSSLDTAVGNPNVFGSVADFGRSLLSTYLLPFEITALVLLIAVIGVVLLAGENAPTRTRGHHTLARPRREREAITKGSTR